MADFASRELLFGLASYESYLDLSAQDLEFGFNETRRDRILRTYVRNVYSFHLNEIFSALKVSSPPSTLHTHFTSLFSWIELCAIVIYTPEMYPLSYFRAYYSMRQNEYTDWEKSPRNPMGSRDAALELLSDGHTAAPLVRLAYMHSLRGGRSYFMHFKHLSSEQDFPQVR